MTTALTRPRLSAIAFKGARRQESVMKHRAPIVDPMWEEVHGLRELPPNAVGGSASVVQASPWRTAVAAVGAARCSRTVVGNAKRFPKEEVDFLGAWTRKGDAAFILLSLLKKSCVRSELFMSRVRAR